MTNANTRVNVAVDTVIALQDKGVSKVDAVDAVAHKAQLDDKETAEVVRKVNEFSKG
jgi:hypothetical protein